MGHIVELGVGPLDFFSTLRGDRAAARRAETPAQKRLGEQLVEQGAIRNGHIRAALREQARSGGRLGEILFAQGTVERHVLSMALAQRHDLPSLVDEYEAVPLLSRAEAYLLRAVVLAGPSAAPGDGVLLVAVTDVAVVRRVGLLLGRAVQPRLCDERRMDELLADAYAYIDGPAAAVALRRGVPRRFLKILGRTALACGAIAIAVYSYLHPFGIVSLGVGAIGLYWLMLAVLSAVDSRHPGTISLARDGGSSDLQPAEPCTVLIPLRRESPASLRRLAASLEAVDHPRHLLQGLALAEPSDRTTRRALRSERLPPWVTVLTIPREAAHGRRGSLLYGLLQTRGRVVAVADSHGTLAADVFRHAHVSGQPAVDASAIEHLLRRQHLKRQFMRQADLAWWDVLAVSAGGRARRVAMPFRVDELRVAFNWPRS